MINFCTLFDSNYLTRGLALYESLVKTTPTFHLYVIAFNEDCYRYLVNRNLPYVTAVSLNEFEDPELLAVKPQRSAAEYCWTCTPSVIQYCINKFQLGSCTYIDADMIFYSDPSVLIDEVGDKSVLISEHRYTKEYDQSETSGKYCVQFMYFRNDAEGKKVLNWWRERCIEWCYARSEDGKFGDQKYLDDWTERFNSVHVMQNEGGGVAPWNVQQYEFNKDPLSMISRQTGKEFKLVFYHFHGLKFFTDDKVSCCGTLYKLEGNVKRDIYMPYIGELMQWHDKLKKEGIVFNINGARQEAPSKTRLFLNYTKDRLSLLKAGKITIFDLGLADFNTHNHVYNLKSLAHG